MLFRHHRRRFYAPLVCRALNFSLFAGLCLLAGCSESPPRPRPAPAHHADEMARGGAPRQTPSEVAPASPADAAAQIDAAGALLAKLPLAKLVFDAPKTLNVGDKAPVELRVGVDVDTDALLRADEPQNQQVQGQAHVSQNVVAELDAPGFAIEAKTPAQQALAAGFPTIWRWDATAQSAGRQTMTATLYALVANGGAQQRQLVKSYSQPVTIGVTFLGWLDAISGDTDRIWHIVETLGLIAAAVAGWFGFKRGKKHGESWSKSE